MRLHPAITQEEAMSWLLAQTANSGLTTMEQDEVRKSLKSMAEAMAAVSAVELPEELAPLFP